MSGGSPVRVSKSRSTQQPPPFHKLSCLRPSNAACVTHTVARDTVSSRRNIDRFPARCFTNDAHVCAALRKIGNDSQAASVYRRIERLQHEKSPGGCRRGSYGGARSHSAVYRVRTAGRIAVVLRICSHPCCPLSPPPCSARAVSSPADRRPSFPC